MTRSIRIGIASMGLALLFAASACTKKSVSRERPPPEVTVSLPVEREILDQDEYPGRVDAKESVEVRARVRGELLDIYFRDGQEVKAGDRLFLIDPKPFQTDVDSAAANVAIAESEFQLAEAKLQRMEEALKKNAIPGIQVIEQRAERDRARASIDRAKAAHTKALLDLGYTTVTAPIAGKVSRAQFTRGNLVNAGGGNDALLTTIEAIDSVFIYFEIDERVAQIYMAQNRKRHEGTPGTPPPSIYTARVPFDVGLATEEGFPHRGTLDFSDNRVDSSTGTVTVRGVVENASRTFAPGFFARARIPIGDRYRALLVAERAIGTDQGQKYLLVIDEKNAVQRRPVRLGRLQDDGLRVILQGISAADRVVTGGVQRARPGATVRVKEGPMPVRPGPAPAGGAGAKAAAGEVKEPVGPAPAGAEKKPADAPASAGASGR